MSYIKAPAACCSGGHHSSVRCPMYFTGHGSVADTQLIAFEGGIVGNYRADQSRIGTCLWEIQLITIPPTGPHFLQVVKDTSRVPYEWWISLYGTLYRFLFVSLVDRTKPCGHSFIIQPADWVPLLPGYDPLEFFESPFEIRFYSSIERANDFYPDLLKPVLTDDTPYYPPG